MAYISKEGYERKKEFAARRMEENRQINTLTAEQHEVLAWLCEVRHEVHSNWNSMFLSESPHAVLWERLDDINNRLSAVNLPNKLRWNADAIDNDATYQISGLTYEAAHEEMCDFLNRVNNDIESFLLSIDKKHKTAYCPLGATRIN